MVNDDVDVVVAVAVSALNPRTLDKLNGVVAEPTILRISSFLWVFSTSCLLG